MAENTDRLSEQSFAIKEVTWKIPNFLDLPRTVGHSEKSPEFRFENATWHFLLFPQGQASDDAGFIRINLVRSQSSVPMHRIHHKIVFKTLHEMGCPSYSFSDTYDNNHSVRGIGRCLPWFKIVAERHLLAPNGTVTVFCQIRLTEGATPRASFRAQEHRNEQSQKELQEESPLTEVLESVSHAKVEEPSSGVEKLQLDYRELLKSEEDSDVCLKVSGKEFRAHKCILKARSKVLSSMLNCETEVTGEVVIDDFDPDAFPDFLQHVYAGRLESLSSNMYSLFSAADKHDLQELKSECRDYMKRTLSVDTFCDVMTLALSYQEEELLKLAIKFFTKNLTKIIVTVRWQMFTKDYNVEANELYIKALVPGKYNES